MKCEVVGISNPFVWTNKKTQQKSDAINLYVVYPVRSGLGQAAENIFLTESCPDFATAVSLKPGMTVSVSRNRFGMVDEINVIPQPEAPASK